MKVLFFTVIAAAVFSPSAFAYKYEYNLLLQDDEKKVFNPAGTKTFEIKTGLKKWQCTGATTEEVGQISVRCSTKAGPKVSMFANCEQLPWNMRAIELSDSDSSSGTVLIGIRCEK